MYDIPLLLERPHFLYSILQGAAANFIPRPILDVLMTLTDQQVRVRPGDLAGKFGATNPELLNRLLGYARLAHVCRTGAGYPFTDRTVDGKSTYRMTVQLSFIQFLVTFLIRLRLINMHFPDLLQDRRFTTGPDGVAHIADMAKNVAHENNIHQAVGATYEHLVSYWTVDSRELPLTRLIWLDERAHRFMAHMVLLQECSTEMDGTDTEHAMIKPCYEFAFWLSQETTGRIDEYAQQQMLDDVRFIKDEFKKAVENTTVHHRAWGQYTVVKNVALATWDRLGASDELRRDGYLERLKKHIEFCRKTLLERPHHGPAGEFDTRARPHTRKTDVQQRVHLVAADSPLEYPDDAVSAAGSLPTQNLDLAGSVAGRTVAGDWDELGLDEPHVLGGLAVDP